MKKTVLVYGTIAGLITALMLVISFGFLMNKNGEMNISNGEVVGYSSMLLAMSMIFIGVRQYKVKYLGGNISFLKAWGAGLLIALIASCFYVITWIIIYKGFMPDFMDKYGDMMLKKWQEQGKSADEIAKATKEMESMKKIYSTWPGLIGLTFMEIFPVGLLISIISAIVFSIKKKKNPPSDEIGKPENVVA